MPAQSLIDLQAAVTNITGVAASAVALINGIAQRISDAIAQAVANGATAEELAPVQGEVDSLNSSAADLAAAVAANSGPPTPTGRK